MEKQIVINNLLINYIEVNPTAVQTAVFLHGWQSNAQSWTTVFDHLQNNQIRLIALDLPGFGKSELPKEAWDVGDYSNFLKFFLNKQGLDRIYLIGHSFGGRVSIKFTALNPELVSKLVLVDSAGFRDKSLAKNIKIGLAEIARPFFKIPGTKKLKKIGSNILGSKDYTESGALKEIFVKVVEEDLTDFLSQIKTRTLLIWGAVDHETPIEFGERMKKLIPQSSLVVLPKAGHFSFIDAPEKFNSKLLDFLL